ncbi:centrosomal protein of 164 kDa isoform X4 [Monodelphis domestica]|uniref:centrosomal protein of 164 kDa isoform X4 n=1 Tax=Monodelphis domestica TaxID=13616 RepID=UPI0007B3FC6E|nr:centrosomal protein of 164 kDa isoform X4 [Monodelphis domestica]
MAGRPIRIGDQLVLEEDYDETYIPSEQEIFEFAREIGIDPNNEPELMWLAREGIVAPLPMEWKPCQDITGDIYYFNFANGQSMWDHPCDEHYRNLVIQERGKLSTPGAIKKKDKRKKKDKKDKKDKELPRTPMETQPDQGILPSASFYCGPSPLSASGLTCLDLEQEIQMKSEGSFRKGKGMCMLGDNPWPIVGALPSKLQPLSKSQGPRTHQIFDDVEKILGRVSASGKTELGDQLGLEKPQKLTEKFFLGFSDPEVEELEMMTKHLKSNTQGPESIRPFQDDPEMLESRSQSSTISKLSEAIKNPQAKGEQLCYNPSKLGLTGPSGDKGRNLVPSAGPGDATSLPPYSCEHLLSSRKGKLLLIDSNPAEELNHQEIFEEGVLLGKGRRKREPQRLWMGQVSGLLSRSDQESCKESEFSDSEVQATSAQERLQGHLLGPPLSADIAPPLVQIAAAQNVLPENICESIPLINEIREISQPLGHPDEDKKPSISEPDLESSSSSSSLASHLGSQVLGEVDNFSWDLQSSRGSELAMGQLGAGLRAQYVHPFLESQLVHTQSSADDRSESEGYSEDQRFYQHILQMVKISRRLEGPLLAEGMQEMPCKDIASMVCRMAAGSPGTPSEGEQEETKATEGESGPMAWAPELLQDPEAIDSIPEGDGATQQVHPQPPSRSPRQEEAELSSSRGLAPESGTRQLLNQALGPSLAPVHVPLGGLAPLRGLIDTSAPTLRSSMSINLGSSVESSQPLETAQLPQGPKTSSHTKSLLGSIHEEKNPLSLLALGEETNEEEESDNQSLGSTAGLLKNLHLDIGVLGGNFDYEESPRSHAEDKKETSLGSDVPCPQTSDKHSSRDIDSSLGSADGEGQRGKLAIASLPGKEDSEKGDPGASRLQMTQGVDSGTGENTGEASKKSLEDPVAVGEVGFEKEEVLNVLEKALTELKTESRSDVNEESEVSDHVQELQFSDHSDPKSFLGLDFGFRSRISEQLLDIDGLSPVLDGPKWETKGPREEEKDQSQSDLEEPESEQSNDEERILGTNLPASISSHHSHAEEKLLSPFQIQEVEEKQCSLEVEPRETEEAEENVLVSPTSQTSSLKSERVISPSPDHKVEEEPQSTKVEREQKKAKELEDLMTSPILPGSREALILESVTLQRQTLGDSLKIIEERTAQDLEEERARLLEDRRQKLERLREELWQEEEEERQRLEQQKDKSLRSLREQLKKATEEEEARVREEENQKLSKFRAQILANTETHENQIRAEQEASLQKVRENLESLQKAEKFSLEQKKKQMLERLKEEIEDNEKREKALLEEENEKAMSQLRERLEDERKEALASLEKEHAGNLERLQTSAEEKHHEVIAGLKKQIEEVHRREEAQLQEELGQAEQRVQQKSYRVTEYEREASGPAHRSFSGSLQLSDLLRDKREDVEKDHERRLDRMKEEHQRVLAEAREQYDDEERKQRADLRTNLSSEMERLRRAHDRELETVRRELERQLSEIRLRHREQERKLEDLEADLESRTKDIKARLVQLDVQEATATHQQLEESRKEQAHLAESTRQLRRTMEDLRSKKVELESQVEVLQARIQRLQRRMSDLEAETQRKQDVLNELAVEEISASPRRDGELHLEDLRKSLGTTLDKELTAGTTLNNEESPPQLDNLRHYLSSEGMSLRSAREFLVRQTRSMRKRQTALKAAQQQWRHDVAAATAAAAAAQLTSEDLPNSHALEDTRKNIEEETKKLDEMKSAMRKGQVLLKKKEEKLSQLENSLREELSDEDTLRGMPGRKVVTFDLSDFEDSSISLEASPLPHGDPMSNIPFSQLSKIQYLSNSLQRITGELNGVLTVLGTLSIQPSPILTSTQVQMPPMPSKTTPISTHPSLTRLSVPTSLAPSSGIPLPNQWAWGPKVSSGLSSSVAQSVDNFLVEKWHKYFPAGVPLLSGSPAPLDNRLGYVSASDQLRLLHRSHSQISQSSGSNFQGMLDSNRKWLEHIKKDPKVPLFSSSPKPSATSNLLQLGLDEYNKLKVYHY